MTLLPRDGSDAPAPLHTEGHQTSRRRASLPGASFRPALRPRLPGTRYDAPVSDEAITREAIDDARVGAWLTEHVRGATPPYTYALITGGRSNLTFRVTDAAGRRFVLRRPPLGHLLATAHDVAREWRIVAALGPTPVPVPPALALCEDEAVNGTPFAVTEFVDGAVLADPAQGATLSPETKRAAAEHLIDVLASLHTLDLDEIGLANLSRREGYIERQLKRWTRQWEGSKTREYALIDEVAARLQSDMPQQQGVSIVHGDYRFGNCITNVAAGRIAAVLDWELCTLGDAMADLGHLGIYWHDPARPLQQANDPTPAGGFPPLGDLLARYAAKTGRDVSRIGYYRAFAAWRLAIIGEGVAARHLARNPDDAEALRGSHIMVNRLVEYARDALS